MKKILLCLCFLLFYTTSIISVAHPGNTDANGGHYNRSTGEYHYHHGYEPHQHDNGVCPYNFEDKTNHGNDGNSNTETYSVTVSTTSSDLWIYLGLGFPIIALVLLYIFALLFQLVKRTKEKLNYKKMRTHYFPLYASREPITFVQVPKGSYLQNGLPTTNGSRKYGKYTVYVTKGGKCFHHNPKCSQNLFTSNYAYEYNRKPCNRCVKEGIPEIQWYLEYKEIVDIKKKYKSHNTKKPPLRQQERLLDTLRRDAPQFIKYCIIFGHP